MAVALVPEGLAGAGRGYGGVSRRVLRSELGLRCLSARLGRLFRMLAYFALPARQRSRTNEENHAPPVPDRSSQGGIPASRIRLRVLWRPSSCARVVGVRCACKCGGGGSVFQRSR